MRTLSLAILLFSLAGCGLKDDLYRPTPANEPAATAPTEEDEEKSEPSSPRP
jgi:predicted small lipoprotein YifL